jgi:hypothetical protein
VILKLDFEKSFDKVEHEVIRILQHKEFPDRWIDWVKGILSSGTSIVMLNDVQSKVFHCKRGVGGG